MKNRLVLIAAFIAILASVAVYGVGTKASQYVAALSGAKEVPPVQTGAKGQATFTVSADAKSIAYVVTVSNLRGPTAAHIHEGAAGKNGPVVVILYPTPSAKTPKGDVLAKGVIRSSDLVGSLKGKTVDDLLKAMKSGNTYVNVHTKAHPGGEIRGQITRKQTR